MPADYIDRMRALYSIPNKRIHEETAREMALRAKSQSRLGAMLRRLLKKVTGK